MTGPPTSISLPNYNPALAIDSSAALIRPPVVAVPNGRTYYLNGCFGIPVLGGVFNSLLSLVFPNLSPATLDSCAAKCDDAGYNAFGMVNGR